MEVDPVTYDKEEYIETVCYFDAFIHFKAIILLCIGAETTEYFHFVCDMQASGNKVSRKTVLCGSQNIVLNGKVIVQTGAIIRGDLSNVRTGRYCVISQKAVIRPAYKQFSTGYVAI